MRRWAFWVGVAVGVVVGAAIAAAYVPMSGEETRARLSERMETLRAARRERRRLALLRLQGKITERVGEAMAEAGRAEQEVARRRRQA
jgi:gas vesicle protein